MIKIVVRENIIKNKCYKVNQPTGTYDNFYKKIQIINCKNYCKNNCIFKINYSK